jgi:hypothetical protein
LSETPVEIPVPGGPRLEGRLAVPAEPRGGLLLCHPHPLYGGDMDNPVVLRAAEVAGAGGLATMRFNFRGVGRSEGVHGGGEPELADGAAALGALRRALPPDRPAAVLGYSFGAWIASRLAMAEPGIAALALVAPALGLQRFDRLAPDGRPVLLVAGSRDPYCPVPELDALARRLPGAERVLIEGAEHFFFGKLHPLGEAVGTWIGRWACH